MAFIATGDPFDGEMKQRIGLHRKERPPHWETFEEAWNVSSVVDRLGARFDWIVVDCLTLLVSNMLLKKFKAERVEAEVERLAQVMGKNKARCILVSNEVGLGIVPANALARHFRDVAGRVNQKVAARADRVVFMISGIPWRIK